MTDKTTGLRCQDGDACAAGQKACPSPKACGCDVQPEALRLADACAGDWEAVRPHLVVQMLRDQHARIKELESSEAQHQQELRAYDLTVQNLRERLEITPGHSIDGIEARDATMKLQDEQIRDLEAQLYAIGAGGVEGLRKRDAMQPDIDRAVMALLQCTASELEDFSPKLLDQYRADATRVLESQAAHPSRECLQQSAERLHAAATNAYAMLSSGMPIPDAQYRIVTELAAALQAAPQAPAGVAVRFTKLFNWQGAQAAAKMARSIKEAS